MKHPHGSEALAAKCPECKKERAREHAGLKMVAPNQVVTVSVWQGPPASDAPDGAIYLRFHIMTGQRVFQVRASEVPA